MLPFCVPCALTGAVSIGKAKNAPREEESLARKKPLEQSSTFLVSSLLLPVRCAHSADNNRDIAAYQTSRQTVEAQCSAARDKRADRRTAASNKARFDCAGPGATVLPTPVSRRPFLCARLSLSLSLSWFGWPRLCSGCCPCAGRKLSEQAGQGRANRP